MCLVSQSWKENIQTAKRRLCSLRRNRENWSDVTVPFLKPTLRWYSCDPQPPLICHLTRIIICCSKQTLNQNKFHPPSKQPIAAHLPPLLKQPHRFTCGQQSLQGTWAVRQPAGLQDREVLQNALDKLRLKSYRREEEVRWEKGKRM